MNKVALMIASALTLLGLSVPANAAQVHTHYGESARTVANEIGCKNLTVNGPGKYNLDSGVCYIKGTRVNVITFRGPVQDGSWNALAEFNFGSGFWWADGKGAVVVAKNGNRYAASLGARRLPAVIKHG